MVNLNLIELHKVLISGEKFVISGHINPDGDAVSAAFAIAKTIAMIGGKPDVILGDFADRYKGLPGNEYLYKGDYADLKADVFIAVDCATKARLGDAEPVFERTPVTVNIDHHATNDGYAEYNFVNPEVSSTCELVYQLINHIVPLDVDIATALYTGIIFDTGGFRHGNVTYDTFNSAAQLVHMGVDFSRINKDVLLAHTMAESKAFGKALINARAEYGGRILATRLTIAELKEANASYEDLDGIVEYLLTTDGAEASILATERPDGMVKVSLRSSELDLTAIVERHGGGGHKHAAGYNAKGQVDEVLVAATRELVSEMMALVSP